MMTTTDHSKYQYFLCIRPENNIRRFAIRLRKYNACGVMIEVSREHMELLWRDTITMDILTVDIVHTFPIEWDGDSDWIRRTTGSGWLKVTRRLFMRELARTALIHPAYPFKDNPPHVR